MNFSLRTLRAMTLPASKDACSPDCNTHRMVSPSRSFSEAFMTRMAPHWSEVSPVRTDGRVISLRVNMTGFRGTTTFDITRPKRPGVYTKVFTPFFILKGISV